MEIKNIFTGETLTKEWFIDLLKTILEKVFNFVATEEGWEVEE